MLVTNTGAGTLTVEEDFNLSGAADFRVKQGGGTATLNVKNYNQSGGMAFIRHTNTSGTGTINVTEAFSLTAGTFNMSQIAAIGALNVGGDFTNSGGEITETSTGSGAIVFNKAGTQIYTSGGTISNTINFTVNSGSTLEMGTSEMKGAGSFTLSAGATLGIGSAAGITSSGASGNIQVTGTRTFNSGASYIYNSSTNQAVGNGLPASVANITIANTGGMGSNTVTGNAGQTVTGLLRVESGVYAGASTYNNVQIDLGATLSLLAAATVSGNWTNNGTFTHNNHAVTFNGTGAQTITTGGTAATKAFNVFTVDKTAGTATLAGSLSAVEINVNNGALDQGASFDVTTSGSGTVATVLSGGTWLNTGTGDLTLSGDVSNAGTINFNANGAGCPQNDDILIRSSISGTPRSWSGTGTFSVTDVNVQDQGGTAIITVHNGTNTGNNGVNWIFLASCTGTAYVWIGATSTDWTVGTNWNPTRVLPSAADVLYFTNSTPTPTVTNVAGAVGGTNETIAELHVNAGVSPSFSTAAGGNTLHINPGTGFTGFDVSSLTVMGSNPLTIKLASGTFGSITGTMRFADAAHRLIGQAASAITFQSGSNFETKAGFTGNAFGDGTSAANGAAGSIVFASDSVYFQNAGGSPFGTTGNAVVTFQTGSEADFRTNSGFEANGRTYATLVIGKGDPGGIPVVAKDPCEDTPGTCTGNFQFDNLVINSSGAGNSELHYSGAGSSVVTIRGNITSIGGASSTLPDIFLSGGAGISINKSGGGVLVFGSGNSRGIDFESDVTVDSATELRLSRIVQTGLGADRVLAVNGTLVANYLGFDGYVVGNLRKNFAVGSNVAQTFEVGLAGFYDPMSVTFASVTSAGSVTATVKSGDLVDLNSPVDNAKSLNANWKLTNSGVAFTNYMVTFNYLSGQIDPGATAANFIVGKRDSGVWTTPAINGTPTNSSITATGMTSMSEFAVGESACSAAAITSQPTSATITYGSVASFTAGASGDPAPTVQWQVSTGGPFADLSNNATYSGVTTTTLTITKPLVSFTDNQYRAVFTNTCNGTQTATSNAATLTVNAKNLTLNGAVAQSKEYDRTDTATVDFSGASLNGVITPDVVTIDSSGYSAVFNDQNVGTGKPMTVMGVVLGGADKDNYTVSQPSGLTADINAIGLTATVDANSKNYDGNATATINSCSFSGVIPGDTVNCDTTGYSASFNNKNVGTDKPVSATGLSKTGADGGNYTFDSTGTGTADINAKDATWTTNPNNKAYGAADPDPLTTGSGTGFLEADNVTATYSRATGETVLGGPYHITAALSPAAVLSNYSITNAGAEFTITAANTVTTVSSNNSPSTYGQNVTFTAELTGSIVTEGQVKFIEGGTCAAPSTTLQAATTVNAQGRVTFTTAALNAGGHTIRACYLGTGNYNESSGTVDQTVNKVVSGIAVSPVNAPFSASDQIVTLRAVVDGNTVAPGASDGSVTFGLPDAPVGTVPDPSDAAVYYAPGTGAEAGKAIYTQKWKIPGGTAGGFLVEAQFFATTIPPINFHDSAKVQALALTIAPGTFLTDVAGVDVDFKKIDGFDALFGRGASKDLLKLKNTNPGTFQYQLTMVNETGVTLHAKNVAINERNGGVITILLTIPGLPDNVGVSPTPNLAPFKGNYSTFATRGHKAVKIHPDDKTDDIAKPEMVRYSLSAPSGDCSALDAASPLWIAGMPPDGARVKCLALSGLALPKKGKARVRVNLEFALKETDGWGALAQTLFRAGFGFKSTIAITLDDSTKWGSLGNQTFTGSQMVGLVGAGQKLTAIGGFVWDGLFAPLVGYKVRLFKTSADADYNGGACSVTNNKWVAQDTTQSDGFYFIWKNGDDQSNIAAVNLSSGFQYVVAVCDLAFASPAPKATAILKNKLADKEFDEEDFYNVQP